MFLLSHILTSFLFPEAGGILTAVGRINQVICDDKQLSCPSGLAGGSSQLSGIWFLEAWRRNLHIAPWL